MSVSFHYLLTDGYMSDVWFLPSESNRIHVTKKTEECTDIFSLSLLYSLTSFRELTERANISCQLNFALILMESCLGSFSLLLTFIAQTSMGVMTLTPTPHSSSEENSGNLVTWSGYVRAIK